ncbi:MAG: hypothetical protein ACFFAO_21975 [Candidatus Hermodarchaeota archaeon]
MKLKKSNQSEIFKIVTILLILIGSFSIIGLYFYFYSAIFESIANYRDIIYLALFIIIRISITIAMTFYAFINWFKQEKLNFSDIFNLFGLFFLGLVFGKAINLLYILTFYSINSNISLILLKIRYLLIVLTAVPLISVGINIVFRSKVSYNEILTQNHQYKINLIIIISIIISMSFFLFISPNVQSTNLTIIIFHILSLIWISYTFYIANKHKLLSEINSLIVSIAFFTDLLLYILAILFLSIIINFIQFTLIFTIFTELIDLIIIIIIFIGFYKKSI